MCAWKQDNLLQDKCIAIAGASCGVGYALARRLAEDYGARVVAIGRRRLYRIEALSRQLGEEHLWVCAGDMSAQEEAKDVLQRIEARTGHLDAYIHTIRRNMSLNALSITNNDFEITMGVNVKSALFGVQAAVPYLHQQQTSSVILYNPRPARTHLASDAVTLATSFALSALASGWSEQLHKHGINVREVVSGLEVTSDYQLLLKALLSTLQMPPRSKTPISTTPDCAATVLGEHGGLTLTQF